ncbi:A-kinase anchor protein 17B-like [Saccopteryx leptura]|uniref:A-kinase anchor protein 17B-like n=1 Tax=Saccopteryx leptura TaxID=249018 RepID=UPI00339C40CC
MPVTVVYDNSEATELCASQHLYLKPIAKLIINVLLPESTESIRPFSNWEVLNQLKILICPDQFTTVRLSKSTKDFIRFEGEAETQSLVQILKAKLHGKIVRLSGLKTDLKIVATDAQGELEHFPKEEELPSSDGTDERPDSIHFKGLPCKWFAPKGSSGEKPCEEILRVVFETFGKIKNVDIPMLDPYREVMTGGSFGCFSSGLQTFEAFIQYQESSDFIKAMESLRGMKLMLKGDDGKALACNIKVLSDKTRHFSEGAIRRRNQERLKLQELEEAKRKEKEREEAERKRKEEKRKKARVRRRAQRERERHQPRHRDRARDKPPGEPRYSEWTKKFLLTQRRGEAFWLLLALLRKIEASIPVNPKETGAAGPEANQSLGNRVQTPKKEQLNTQYLQNREKMPGYQSYNSGRKRKQKGGRIQLCKLSRRRRRRRRRRLGRKRRTRKLLTNGFSHNFFCNNTLQITLIQDQPLEKEDHLSYNISYPYRSFETVPGRKKKIYETCECIDFLLDHYYHIPKYPSICLEPSDPTSTYQWQRSVQAKGNGFQINLRKYKCYSTSMSQIQNLQRKEQVQEENHWPKTDTQDPMHKPQNKANEGNAKICSQEFQTYCKDRANEAAVQLTPTYGKDCLSEKTHANQVKYPKSSSQSQVSSPERSEDVELNLTDFLENISSDSDCFSETLTTNKEEKEKSMATFETAPNGGSLDDDEIIVYYQEISSSQLTSESKWEHFKTEEHSKEGRKKSEEKSEYEQRYSLLEGENNSTRAQKSNSEEKKNIAPECLLEQDDSYKSRSSGRLDNSTRKRRRCSDNTLDEAGNDLPFHVPDVPVTSPECADAMHWSCSPQSQERLGGVGI